MFADMAPGLRVFLDIRAFYTEAGHHHQLHSACMLAQTQDVYMRTDTDNILELTLPRTRLVTNTFKVQSRCQETLQVHARLLVA